VETLGATTVLCVDKTGTLTLNQMSVRQLFVYGETDDRHTIDKTPTFYDLMFHAQHPIPEDFHGLIEFGILANRKDPFDPMEKALQRIGQNYLANTEHLHGDWRLLHEYPLSKELLAMSCVWESPSADLKQNLRNAMSYIVHPAYPVNPSSVSGPSAWPCCKGSVYWSYC
jgi:P-type Ca2+ transporter type 2C